MNSEQPNEQESTEIQHLRMLLDDREKVISGVVILSMVLLLGMIYFLIQCEIYRQKSADVGIQGFELQLRLDACQALSHPL